MGWAAKNRITLHPAQAALKPLSPPHALSLWLVLEVLESRVAGTISHIVELPGENPCLYLF